MEPIISSLYVHFSVIFCGCAGKALPQLVIFCNIAEMYMVKCNFADFRKLRQHFSAIICNYANKYKCIGGHCCFSWLSAPVQNLTRCKTQMSMPAGMLAARTLRAARLYWHLSQLLATLCALVCLKLHIAARSGPEPRATFHVSV